MSLAKETTSSPEPSPGNEIVVEDHTAGGQRHELPAKASRKEVEINELPKTAPDHTEVDSPPEQEEHGLDSVPDSRAKPAPSDICRSRNAWLTEREAAAGQTLARGHDPGGHDKPPAAVTIGPLESAATNRRRWLLDVTSALRMAS
jgi:hypothetical protein